MKQLTFFFCLLFPFAALAQGSDSTWFVNNYVKKEVSIPMRDGVKLLVSVYLPKDKSEKHPILMERTPYSCSPYGKDYRAFWADHLIRYCKKRYIMVIEDVRGRWMSEGDFADVRPFNFNKKTNKDIDESSDTYDTIDWLVKNLENNNGKVGVFGISYPGFYSTMASLSGHPALKAVSPEAPVTNNRLVMGPWFHGQWRNNYGNYLSNVHWGSNTSEWYATHAAYRYLPRRKGGNYHLTCLKPIRPHLIRMLVTLRNPCLTRRMFISTAVEIT